MQKNEISAGVPTATALGVEPSESDVGVSASVTSDTEPPAPHEEERSRHTRISGAWAAVFVGVILGIALIDFIVENTRSVRIDFFSAGGRMPVAVALLAAALAGAAVVLVVGSARTAQLRLTLRRHRKQSNIERTRLNAAATEGAQR